MNRNLFFYEGISMSIFKSTSLTEEQRNSRVENIQRSQITHLPMLLEADGATEDGIAVTGYGKGRVSGVFYTVL